MPEAPAAAAWGQTPSQNAGAGQQPGPAFDNAGYGAFGGPLDRGATPAAGAAMGGQRPGVIIVRQGKEPGRVFEIRNDRLTIGRSRDSDIFLEDLAVSRLHATVTRDASGQYKVRDENSANGTTVNGQRIGERVLEEGDEIALGQTVLTFQRR
jgi:pSer/pThr/pTyr-binding forkhead associated (FHA) protein